MSHPAWGAWIEISTMGLSEDDSESHPAWGAWIEITVWKTAYSVVQVAPRMGCVD